MPGQLPAGPLCPGDGPLAEHCDLLTPALCLPGAWGSRPGAWGGRHVVCRPAWASDTLCSAPYFVPGPVPREGLPGNSGVPGTVAEGRSLPGRPPPAPGVSLACLASHRSSQMPRHKPRSSLTASNSCAGAAVCAGHAWSGPRVASGLHPCVSFAAPVLRSICLLLTPNPHCSKSGGDSKCPPRAGGTGAWPDDSGLQVLRAP